jgi:hypothetical protein
MHKSGAAMNVFFLVLLFLCFQGSVLGTGEWPEPFMKLLLQYPEETLENLPDELREDLLRYQPTERRKNTLLSNWRLLMRGVELLNGATDDEKSSEEYRAQLVQVKIRLISVEFELLRYRLRPREYFGLDGA